MTVARGRPSTPYAEYQSFAGDPRPTSKKVDGVGINTAVAKVLLAHTLNRDRDKRSTSSSPTTSRASPRPAPRSHASAHRTCGRLRRQHLRRRTAHGQADRRSGTPRPPVNHATGRSTRPVSSGLPMMCVHTPADNCVNLPHRAVRKREAGPAQGRRRRVEKDPRYGKAVRRMAGPKIVSGKRMPGVEDPRRDDRETEGAKTIYEQFAISRRQPRLMSGCTSARREALENAKNRHLNVIIAGHVSAIPWGSTCSLMSWRRTGPEHVNISDSRGYSERRSAGKNRRSYGRPG